jgi:hypothetical protein
MSITIREKPNVFPLETGFYTKNMRIIKRSRINPNEEQCKFKTYK